MDGQVLAAIITAIFAVLYLRIDECMKSQYTDSGYEEFMRECQNVLQRVWKRMKIETGMDIKDDLAIRKKVLGH